VRRRHPAARQLGAFFDGEDAPGVADHLAACPRCRAGIQQLRRVRAALHGEPLPPALAAPRRWPVVVIAPATVVLILLAASLAQVGPDVTDMRFVTGGRPATPVPEIPVPEVVPTPAPSPDKSRSGPAGGIQPPAATDSPAGQPDAPGEPEGPATPSSSPAAAPPADSHGPLRLGVVTITKGLLAGEGREAAEAVRRVAEQANRSGGVAGRPVEVVVVPAEDQAAVAGMARRVDVMVGGFGVPAVPGAGWLLPADPAVSGTEVVRPELVAEEAGSRLAPSWARGRRRRWPTAWPGVCRW
jgi:hypothetical protein